MLKTITLNLHIYGGLLCFSYLIIFGLSSLNFNHRYEFTRRKGEVKEWERAVELAALPRVTADMSEKEAMAAKARANHAVRRALGLFGNQRPWAESWWDKANPNHYHASLVRPGREYEVDVYLDRKVAQVKERKTSPWQVLRALHGLHEKMPDSPLVSTWAWYTEFCTFSVLFAGVSGIYLWTRRQNERRIGVAILGAAGAVSIGLIVCVALGI